MSQLNILKLKLKNTKDIWEEKIKSISSWLTIDQRQTRKGWQNVKANFRQKQNNSNNEIVITQETYEGLLIFLQFF